MNKTITIIRGDGIGPEITDASLRVLQALDCGLAFEFATAGLAALDQHGSLLPASTLESIARTRVALKGPLTTPVGEGFSSLNVELRRRFDLYANVRPVKALHDRLVPLKGRTAKDVDMVVFRENTEGIYVGMGGQFKRGTPDEVAINEDLNTRKGVERIIRAAFEYAKANGKTRVCMADKSNAMRHAHELWYRVFDEVKKEYASAGIEGRHLYVDALCLLMVQDPSQFQVLVMNNLFGDIVTDLGAAFQGGLGMAASANIHASDPNRVAMFEPVHGSAPPLAGRDIANPFAALLTVGMMLKHLGFPNEEQRIERVVAEAIEEKACTVDVGGALGTRAAAAWVRERVAKEL